MGTTATSSGGSAPRNSAINLPVVLRVNRVSPQIGQTSAGTFRTTANPLAERGNASEMDFSSHGSPHEAQHPITGAAYALLLNRPLL